MNSENLEKTLAATVFLFFLCLLPAMRNTVAVDPDLPWHIRTGDLILAQHSVPHSESFAWPLQGKPLVAYSWLFEVLVSKCYSLGGFKGVDLLVTLLTALMFSALLFVLYRQCRELYGAAFMMAVVGAGLSPVNSPRPWLFTILFFTVELALVLEARKTGPKRLLWLLPIFALWANIHIQFVYGLFLLGLLALEATAAELLPVSNFSKQLSPLNAWGALFGCLLATLANPYGWRLYEVVWQYSTQHAALAYITEMQAPQFRSITDYISLMAVAGIGVIAGIRRRNADFLLLLLCAVGAYLTFRSYRDVWFLLIPAGVLLCFPLTAPESRMNRSSPVLAFAVACIAGSLVVLFGVETKTLLNIQAKNFPVAAVDYVRNHNLHGRLYNTFAWGGYLIWRLPDSQVSIDGRANLYGDKKIAQAVKTTNGVPGWQDDPELSHADIIIVEKQSALCSLVELDPRFHLVYADELAAVFLPEHSAMGPD